MELLRMVVPCDTVTLAIRAPFSDDDQGVGCDLTCGAIARMIQSGCRGMGE